MTNLKRIRLFYGLALILFAGLTGCDHDESPKADGIMISGTAHKGPFVIGSELEFTQITKTGTAAGPPTISHTHSQFGEFALRLTPGNIYRMSVNGFYYNEVSTKLSSGKISLNAVFTTDSGNPAASVNVLTHITYPRVLYLMAEGLQPDQANAQAARELLDSFSTLFRPANATPFARFSLARTAADDHAGAYLLAVSATLVQYAMIESKGNDELVEGNLSRLMKTLSEDLEADGVIDDALILEQMRQSMQRLDPNRISTGLLKRYEQTGQTGRIPPDINTIIDTDGDGLTNAEDDDDDGDGLADNSDNFPYFNDDRTIDFQIKLSNPEPIESETRIEADTSLFAAHVGKVRFFINGKSIGEAVQYPFSVRWNPYFWAEYRNIIVHLEYTNAAGKYITGPARTITIGAGAVSALNIGPAHGEVITGDGLQFLPGLDIGFMHLQMWHGDAMEDKLLVRYVAPYFLSAQDPAYFFTPIEPGEYTWRIRASGPIRGPWSSPRRFSVANTNPAGTLKAVLNGPFYGVEGEKITISAARSYDSQSPWVDNSTFPITTFIWNGEINTTEPVYTFSLGTTEETIVLNVSKNNFISYQAEIQIFTQFASTKFVDIVMLYLTAAWPGGAAQGKPNDPLNIEFIIANNGNDPAQNVPIKFYLSRDRHFDETDLEISNFTIPALAALSNQTLNTTLTLPAQTSPGEYYIIAIADPDDVIAEIDDDEVISDMGDSNLWGNNNMLGNVLSVQ